jgi:hypothetical protein
MKCSRCRKYLDLYLDNQLEQKIRDEVDYHLQQCNECRQYYRQGEELLKDMKNLPPLPLPDDFIYRVKGAIAQQKKKPWYAFVPPLWVKVTAAVVIAVPVLFFFINENPFYQKSITTPLIDENPQEILSHREEKSEREKTSPVKKKKRAEKKTTPPKKGMAIVRNEFFEKKTLEKTDTIRDTSMAELSKEPVHHHSYTLFLSLKEGYTNRTTKDGSHYLKSSGRFSNRKKRINEAPPQNLTEEKQTTPSLKHDEKKIIAIIKKYGGREIALLSTKGRVTITYRIHLEDQKRMETYLHQQYRFSSPSYGKKSTVITIKVVLPVPPKELLP